MKSMDARRILEERARKLAQPAVKLELEIDQDQLVVFERGNGRYALDMRFLQEVSSVTAYAELPGMPDHCLGVATARGELVALFDLAVLLGEPRSTSPVRCMLLCGEARPELAIAIDRAVTLADARPLFEPPAAASTLISGVHPDGFVVIDGTALLSDARLNLAPAAQENSP